MLTFTIGPVATCSPPEFLTSKDLHDNPYGIWAFRSIAADFAFFIDGNLALQEPDWNVGELAMQLAKWLSEGLQHDFRYDCMDAEERDLFTFRKHGDSFQFYSEWAEAHLPLKIESTVMADFIAQFRSAVKRRIESELGFTVSHYLG